MGSISFGNGRPARGGPAPPPSRAGPAALSTSYVRAALDITTSPARPPGLLARALGSALGFVLPAGCLGCGARLPDGPAAGRAHLGLCLGCRGRLVRPPSGCAVCGVPIPAAVLAVKEAAAGPRLGTSSAHRCGDCRRQPPPFAALRAAWSYQGPLAAVIRGLKFRRLDYLGVHLARDLRDLVLEPGWSLVVPVPLHWRRRWLRGYNQAERIAHPLARLLGVPSAELLRRRRATRPQTDLAREERLTNPRGAFVLRSGRWSPEVALARRRLGGGRVLLIDDVVTTGATLRAAAEALRQAGAGEVVALAAARTAESG
jgi:ComF family protein